MKLPNPLSPTLMKPMKRRAEICSILARGLVRLKARESIELLGENGESSLHFTADRSGHANPE